MNCRDIETLLAKGQPLDAVAEEHFKECAGCRSLMKALNAEGDPVNESRISKIVAELLAGMSRVRPLPPDPVLILLVATIFVGFCLLIVAVVGLQGFVHLSPTERIVYYGFVFLFGFLFSVAAVQAGIPGAKVRVHRESVVAGSFLVVAIVVAILFRNFELDHFVAQGISCLRLGCICAALFGVIAAVILRRGYVTDVGTTALLMGCFAGFSGVAILSLHCPLHNAAHIIVWHLGVIALSGLGGLAIGWVARRRA